MLVLLLGGKPLRMFSRTTILPFLGPHFRFPAGTGRITLQPFCDTTFPPFGRTWQDHSSAVWHNPTTAVQRNHTSAVWCDPSCAVQRGLAGPLFCHLAGPLFPPFSRTTLLLSNEMPLLAGPFFCCSAGRLFRRDHSSAVRWDLSPAIRQEPNSTIRRDTALTVRQDFTFAVQRDPTLAVQWDPSSTVWCNLAAPLFNW